MLPPKLIPRQAAVASGLLSLLAAFSHEWSWSLALAGLALIFAAIHVGFVQRRRCGAPAPSSASGRCARKRTGGLIRGCDQHEYWRLRALFGLTAAAPAARSVAGEPDGVASGRGRREIIEAAAAVCTIVGGVAGAISALVGVVGLVLQLNG